MAQLGDTWQSGDVKLYCADCRDGANGLSVEGETWVRIRM